MGISALKSELREKILAYQYHTLGDDIWEYLDTYDRYLSFSDSRDELAEAAFLRGDVAFHLGRYHDAMEALTKSLQIEKSADYAYLETDAHNLLGMLFSFVGYEAEALDHYLSALESARMKKNLYGEVSALLNIGLLYESMHDYKKAMSYYQKGCHVANGDLSASRVMLFLLGMIQQAQLLCRMGRYEEAEKKKREIDSYYHIVQQDEILLSESILEVQLADHAGNDKKVEELTHAIRHFLNHDDQYLEQIDTYVEFCRFLVRNGKEEHAREFLHMLQEKISVTEFLHFRLKIEELEVQFQRRYGDEEHYKLACVHYQNMVQEHADTLKSFRRKNLLNIENLQELEKRRLEFEIKSKCDLVTGLLNKKAFQQEVEEYLTDRKRNITDAMVMIDIDNFKLINDSFGHLIGDAVINRLSDLIKDQFGKEICGRFGGDEFLLFIKGCEDMAAVEAKVEYLRESFHALSFGKNKDLHNTLSIGVSYNNGVNTSYNTMFSCADEALAKAKEYGKNRVAFFEIKRGLLKYV